jgi:hypothetical protein
LSRDLRRERIIEEGGKVFRAYQTSNDNFDQAIADHLGMNRTDMRCIDLIDQAGGMTAGELARAAGLTTGAEATPKVWELTGPLMGPFIAESSKILDDYSTEELERFAEFLNRVIDVQGKYIERIREM